jgi:hypothetical protein
VARLLKFQVKSKGHKSAWRLTGSRRNRASAAFAGGRTRNIGEPGDRQLLAEPRLWRELKPSSMTLASTGDSNGNFIW